jgi:hypothetical protein
VVLQHLHERAAGTDEEDGTKLCVRAETEEEFDAFLRDHALHRHAFKGG